MYQRHPSQLLTERFARRPFQGAEPSASTFLFVGLDANYKPDLEQSSSFQNVLSYHDDGVAFWRRHGVHHPFLLPGYRGDGRRYHQTFARIGLNASHAHLVSFVELLHVPTVGRNKLEVTDLDVLHLSRLNDAILHGAARHIFIPAGVARLMRMTGVFPWLPKAPTGSAVLRTLYADRSRFVYSHLHFSNYGKFQQQLDAEQRAIAALIPSATNATGAPSQRSSKSVS